MAAWNFGLTSMIGGKLSHARARQAQAEVVLSFSLLSLVLSLFSLSLINMWFVYNPLMWGCYNDDVWLGEDS